MADEQIKVGQAGNAKRLQDQGDGTLAEVVSLGVGAGVVPDGQSFASLLTRGWPVAAAVSANDFEPASVSPSTVGVPRMDETRNLYHRQSWRDIAAKSYENIIDYIGLGSLQLILPLWERQGSPYRSLVNRDKSFTGWGVVTPGQPGGLHQIVALDGTSGYIQEDPIVYNYTTNTYDVTMSGATTLTAQQFIPTQTCSVGFVRALIRKVGAPGGNVKMAIYSDLAGSPNAVISNGTSNVLAFTSVTSAGYIGFSFTNAPVLTAGTTYWLVLVYDTPSLIDASNLVEWQYDTVGTYGLPRATFNGTVWTVQTGQSFAFDIYDNVLALGTNANWTLLIGGQWLGGLGTNGYLFEWNGMANTGTIAYIRRVSTNAYSMLMQETGGVNDGVNPNIHPSDYGIWALSYSYVGSAPKTSVYRNGLLLGTHAGTASTAPPLQAQPLTLGTQQGSFGFGAPTSISNAWNGTVGPVILCNALLTATQISQITNQLLALRRYQEAI